MAYSRILLAPSPTPAPVASSPHNPAPYLFNAIPCGRLRTPGRASLRDTFSGGYFAFGNLPLKQSFFGAFPALPFLCSYMPLCLCVKKHPHSNPVNPVNPVYCFVVKNAILQFALDLSARIMLYYKHDFDIRGWRKPPSVGVKRGNSRNLKTFTDCARKGG